MNSLLVAVRNEMKALSSCKNAGKNDDEYFLNLHFIAINFFQRFLLVSLSCFNSNQKKQAKNRMTLKRQKLQ